MEGDDGIGRQGDDWSLATQDETAYHGALDPDGFSGPLEVEGHTVVQKGKRHVVADCEKRLVKL